MHHAPLNVARSQFFCCMTIFHFQWNLPLTLPSPRDRANKAGTTRGERMKGEGTCVFYATLGIIQGGFKKRGKGARTALSARILSGRQKLADTAVRAPILNPPWGAMLPCRRVFIRHL